MLRLPTRILSQTDGYIELFVAKDIETLNNFFPSTKAISNCEKKQLKSGRRIDWKYQAQVYEKYKRQWAAVLSVLPKMDRKERIVDTIIISRRVRLIDLENLYGGSKPIRDTLQRRGWLYDDAPRWGGLQVIQEKVSKSETGTIIKLRKVNEDQS